MQGEGCFSLQSSLYATCPHPLPESVRATESVNGPLGSHMGHSQEKAAVSYPVS